MTCRREAGLPQGAQVLKEVRRAVSDVQRRIQKRVRPTVSARPRTAHGELPYNKGWSGGVGHRSEVKQSENGAGRC